MTDQELKDLVASIASAQLKTDAQLAKTDAKLNRMAEMYGGVGNNQGRVAEEFFFNSLKSSPILNGITYDFVDKNVTRYQRGIEDEFDILLVNGHDVSVIEVKYRAHPDDLTLLLEKKASNFKLLFPQYKDYRHHLVLATFSIDDELKKKAVKAGVIVLQRKGDLLETTAA